MRLSPSDEAFTHQVALPHAMVGSSDPSWRERYWISAQDTTGDAVLTCGFGQYPNQDVQEAFAVFSSSGSQWNLRLSRELRPDREHLRTGPFSIEVVRPFEELHMVLDDNESGLAFDLTWESQLDPILEERHFQYDRARVTYDAIRYVQLGRVQGVLSSPAGEITVHPETWWSERDHSWGTRPLPHQDSAPPLDRPAWSFLMFCPIQFEDFSAHVYLFEDDDGAPVHVSAGLAARRGGTGTWPRVVDVEHDLVWDRSASVLTLASGTLTFVLAGGQRLSFEMTARPGRAHLRGGGYNGWNGWYQGHWKGENSLEHDHWDLTDQSVLYRYASASSDHLIEVVHEDQRGYGVIEYVVRGSHRRYGVSVPPRRPR
ncbi:MAG TPA: hypothetical protein VG435_18075 [Acidimicrobiales bacterium]|nr:hypothetical protein [Acidimicrobiales bacterium]